MPNIFEADAFNAPGILPEEFRDILDRFVRQKRRVWVVGGALRDLLLRRAPKDWDIATDALPGEVMAIFPRVIPIGIRHGTVQIHSGELTVEVVSCPGAGLEGILADLRRRDFTVNALAFSYPEGILMDPFRGKEDLKSRILRAVQDAPARFGEDPLRTLRAGRFMSVYGFHMDPQTFIALRNAAPELHRTARERVREELFKMLTGEYFAEAFRWMVQGGVIQEVLPEVVRKSAVSTGVSPLSESMEHAVRTVQLSPQRLRVRLAALFHNVGGSEAVSFGGEERRVPSEFHRSALVAADIMRRLRSSRKEERAVARLVEHQIPGGAEAWSGAEVRRFLAQAGDDLLVDLVDLARAERMARRDGGSALKDFEALRLKMFDERERRQPLRIGDLAVNGRDVMSILGIGPGPLVGQLMQSAYRKILEDPGLNERKILTDFLVKVYHTKFQSSANEGG